MINDPISDMLTRIRNGILREKKQVAMPSSKMLVSIAKILEEEGFINGYEVVKEEEKPQNTLVVSLKYVNGRNSIFDLQRISKPGLRKYSGYKDIMKYKKGIGIAIISTSKGLMTGERARVEKLGGEVLAKVW